MSPAVVLNFSNWAFCNQHTGGGAEPRATKGSIRMLVYLCEVKVARRHEPHVHDNNGRFLCGRRVFRSECLKNENVCFPLGLES